MLMHDRVETHTEPRTARHLPSICMTMLAHRTRVAGLAAGARG